MEIGVKRRSGPPPKNIEGERFDRLIAERYAGKGKWACLCDCGNTSVVDGADLRRGKVRSCGCLQLEIAKTGDCRRTHGHTDTPEYRSWSAMIRRCADPNARGYHRYGGRGIKVCERWVNSVEDFVADMGPRPPGTSIDRWPDADGDYEPGNCRWATAQEQAANMSTTVLITANGKSQPIEAWARELGVSSQALRYRLKCGMSHDAVVNTPFRAHKRW